MQLIAAFILIFTTYCRMLGAPALAKVIFDQSAEERLQLVIKSIRSDCKCNPGTPLRLADQDRTLDDREHVIEQQGQSITKFAKMVNFSRRFRIPLLYFSLSIIGVSNGKSPMNISAALAIWK
jgi:hypothetical protein